MELHEIIERLRALRKPGPDGIGEVPKYPGLIDYTSHQGVAGPELAAMRVLEALEGRWMLGAYTGGVDARGHCLTRPGAIGGYIMYPTVPEAVLRAVYELEELEL